MRQPLLGQRYGGGYDSRSHRRPEMFPAPGMRGKYGADIAIKGAALSGAFLSCDRPNFPGSAAPALSPPLLVILARGGGRSKGGALAPPFHVSPRDTGEADWFFHFWTKEVFHAVNYNRYKAQGDIYR